MLSHESLAVEHWMGIKMKPRDLDDQREREREMWGWCKNQVCDPWSILERE